MAKGILVVATRPVAGGEDEYNAWYDGTHIPQMTAVPGIVGARRYRVRDGGQSESDPDAPTYLAVYEIEADDLDAPMKEMAARGADGRLAAPPPVAGGVPPVVRFYELME